MTNITFEQWTALLVAATALVTAIGATAVQLRGLRKDLNGRVSQLIEAATAASRKQGELEGRDFMQRLHDGPSADVPGVPPQQQ